VSPPKPPASPGNACQIKDRTALRCIAISREQNTVNAVIDAARWTGNIVVEHLLAMTPEELAGLAVALLAGSELLSYIPGVKANGWVQLILAALRGIAAAKQVERSNTKRR